MPRGQSLAPEKIIEDLQAKKAEAVQNGDYELAKSLRLTTERLKVMQQAIEHTNNCKQAALHCENYDLAQALLADLSELNQTFNKIYCAAAPNAKTSSAEDHRGSRRGAGRSNDPAEPAIGRVASMVGLPSRATAGLGRTVKRESRDSPGQDGRPVAGHSKRGPSQVDAGGEGSTGMAANGSSKRAKNGSTPAEHSNATSSTPLSPRGPRSGRNDANNSSPKEVPSLHVFKVPEFHIQAAPADNGAKWLGCFLTDNPDKFLAAYPQLLRLPYSDRINVVARAQMLFSHKHSWTYPNEPRQKTNMRILPKARKSAQLQNLDWKDLVLLGNGCCWTPPTPRIGVNGRSCSVPVNSKHENYLIQIPQNPEEDDATVGPTGDTFKFYPPLELSEAGNQMLLWLPVVKDNSNNNITRQYVYITISVKMYQDNEEESWSTTFWANAPRYIGLALEQLFPNGAGGQGRLVSDEWGGGPPGGLAVRTVRPATHILPYQ